MFISLEGGEGTGKTTLMKMIKEEFEKSNIEVVLTREPGGTDISEQIRDIILELKNSKMTAPTEALLYAASRAQHLDEVIIPSLNEKKIVICDRYVDSSFVYQGYARGLGKDFVEKINEYAMHHMPDVTFYIDLDPQIGKKRISNRDNLDRLDVEKEEFHQKVRSGYLNLAKDNSRIIVINGDRKIEEIFSDIIYQIKKII